MTNGIITTDSPLNTIQQATLGALLDVIIPADEKRGLPSARELDLVNYLGEHASEFMPVLRLCVDNLDDEFHTQTWPERHLLVETFARTHADLFKALLFHTFACYYQNGDVLEAIGLDSGPPFPRGNEVESGDLSLLDPVLKRPRLYRT